MPRAEADLDEYAAYIARDSVERAIHWLETARDVIRSLDEYPKRFSVIPESEDLGVELRDVIHYSHRIIYRVRDSKNTVEILRVYHGSRKRLTENDLV